MHGYFEIVDIVAVAKDSLCKGFLKLKNVKVKQGVHSNKEVCSKTKMGTNIGYRFCSSVLLYICILKNDEQTVFLCEFYCAIWKQKLFAPSEQNHEI